jgi:hypothetical protein
MRTPAYSRALPWSFSSEGAQLPYSQRLPSEMRRDQTRKKSHHRGHWMQGMKVV